MVMSNIIDNWEKDIIDNNRASKCLQCKQFYMKLDSTALLYAIFCNRKCEVQYYNIHQPDDLSIIYRERIRNVK